jgi:hypothetical protein
MKLIPTVASKLFPALSASIIFLLSAVPMLSQAAIVDFNNNDITYGGALINVGGAYSRVTESNSTKTKLPDGYKITDLSYSVQKTAAGDGITTTWLSSRTFNLSDVSDVNVSLKGDTGVTFGTGSLSFMVAATIDGTLVTQFQSNLTPPGDLGLTWDKSAVKLGLAKGDHTLGMFSQVV